MALVGPRKTRTESTPPGTELEVASKVDVPLAFSTPTPKPRAARKSSVLSIAVMAVIVPGLFATIALPAYAFQPVEDTQAADAAQALQELTVSEAQNITVGQTAAAASVARDAFGATSAAEIERAALAAAAAAYTGPTYASALANPPYPNFDLSQVAAVAMQYQGVPYVFGGSDPSGFDCSGLVSYVYAQFGIALPHSVNGIAAAGTVIATDAALPGDIVTMSGHNGIYMGNGMILDAPDVGRSVMLRPIWTSDYYIVRIGI